jgi:hypothetical protein
VPAPKIILHDPAVTAIVQKVALFTDYNRIFRPVLPCEIEHLLPHGEHLKIAQFVPDLRTIAGKEERGDDDKCYTNIFAHIILSLDLG